MLHLLIPVLFIAALVLGQDITACSGLPPTINYSNAKLPDPFLSLNGTRLTKKEQWTYRKEEIRRLFQRYSYGQMPPKPALVTASLSGSTLKITVNGGGKAMSFAVSIRLPSSGSAPYSAIITYGGSSLPIPNTVATITYQNFDMAANNDRGKGKFYDLYGNGHSAGGMIVAAWGVDRIMDALELTQADTKIDPKRVGVTGCSRNGKGSMIAGAFVDRIALALPQEEWHEGRDCSPDCQRRLMVLDRLPKYVDAIPTMPWDNHMLHALYAQPARGLLIVENTGIDYLGPTSNYHCATAGRMVHQTLGVKDYFGLTQFSRSDYCGFHKEQQPPLTAFIERLLLGKDTKTGFWTTDGKWPIDESRWVDWAIPTLAQASNLWEYGDCMS